MSTLKKFLFLGLVLSLLVGAASLLTQPAVADCPPDELCDPGPGSDDGDGPQEPAEDEDVEDNDSSDIDPIVDGTEFCEEWIESGSSPYSGEGALATCLLEQIISSLPPAPEPAEDPADPEPTNPEPTDGEDPWGTKTSSSEDTHSDSGDETFVRVNSLTRLGASL